MEAVDDFGRLVRSVRTARGLSQMRLARISGTDQAVISLIERGKHASDGVQGQRLAKALGLPAPTATPKKETSEGPRLTVVLNALAQTYGVAAVGAEVDAWLLDTYATIGLTPFPQQPAHH